MMKMATCDDDQVLNESASSPLVAFGWLNDNVIKGLTRLLSVDR